MNKTSGLYVQYGAGFSAPPGWLNFDSSPTLRFERTVLVGRLYTKNKERFPKGVVFGDIVRRLPLEKSSCAGVYASHVLEHLSLEEFNVALRNTYKILRPGGVFRAVVPDLEVYARKYLDQAAAGDPEASSVFMRATGLGMEIRPKGVMPFLRSWLGHSRHLWMWDYPSLYEALSNTGFASIRRCEYGDCADPAFGAVEDPARFVDAVAVEARK